MLTHILLSLLPLTFALAAPHSPPSKRDFHNVYNCVNSGQVALTFDDGPYYYDRLIAGELNGGKGTWFVNGNNYGCIYDFADDIIALHNAGHTLGSHSRSHPDMTSLSEDGRAYQNFPLDDMRHSVEEAFSKILGLKPKYFRPPYGSTNSILEAVLAQRGYTRSFLWSDDTGDSTGASVQSSESVYDGVANSYPSTHLILNHAPVESTAYQVVPYAVGELAGKGYQLVAVDTCLGNDGEWPYYYIGPPGQRDDSWHC